MGYDYWEIGHQGFFLSGLPPESIPPSQYAFETYFLRFFANATGRLTFLIFFCNATLRSTPFCLDFLLNFPA